MSKLNNAHIHSEDELTQYEHHDMMVTVTKEYKGKHKDICVCHSCEKFKWWSEQLNCPYAMSAFALSRLVGITTVMECQYYERVLE